MIAEGEFAQVNSYFQEALERPSEILLDVRFFHLLVDNAILQEDIDSLEELTPRFLELAELHEHDLYNAIANRSIAVLHRLKGELNKPKKLLEISLKIFKDLETHWQIGRTYNELGQLAIAQEKTSEAKDQFTQALEAYKILDARIDIEKTQRALDEIS